MERVDKKDMVDKEVKEVTEDIGEVVIVRVLIVIMAPVVVLGILVHKEIMVMLVK
jgi:hypothetical protein